MTKHSAVFGSNCRVKFGCQRKDSAQSRFQIDTFIPKPFEIKRRSNEPFSGVSCHACTRVAWADPNTVAATRFVAVEKVLEVTAKSGGIELPEPITMGTSIVLADCIDEHVLTWHRVVSPAGSIRRVLSGPWLGADGAPGLVWGQQSAAGWLSRRIIKTFLSQ